MRFTAHICDFFPDFRGREVDISNECEIKYSISHYMLKYFNFNGNTQKARVHNPWKKDSDEALRGDSLHLKMKLSSNDLSYFTEKLFCFWA